MSVFDSRPFAPDFGASGSAFVPLAERVASLSDRCFLVTLWRHAIQVAIRTVLCLFIIGLAAFPTIIDLVVGSQVSSVEGYQRQLLEPDARELRQLTGLATPHRPDVCSHQQSMKIFCSCRHSCRTRMVLAGTLRGRRSTTSLGWERVESLSLEKLARSGLEVCTEYMGTLCCSSGENSQD
jgi:hypothetical protein